jgi:hypothetical protein
LSGEKKKGEKNDRGRSVFFLSFYHTLQKKKKKSGEKCLAATTSDPILLLFKICKGTRSQRRLEGTEVEKKGKEVRKEESRELSWGMLFFYTAQIQTSKIQKTAFVPLRCMKKKIEILLNCTMMTKRMSNIYHIEDKGAKTSNSPLFCSSRCSRSQKSRKGGKEVKNCQATGQVQ